MWSRIKPLSFWAMASFTGLTRTPLPCTAWSLSFNAAIPQVQVALAGGVIDVEAQLELVDPVELSTADVAVINEGAVVAVVERPFAGLLGVADVPLIRPRHVRPARICGIEPLGILFDGHEVFGGLYITFVGILGRCARREPDKDKSQQQRDGTSHRRGLYPFANGGHPEMKTPPAVMAWHWQNHPPEVAYASIVHGKEPSFLTFREVL